MAIRDGTADILYVARMTGVVTRDEVDLILRGVKAASNRLRRPVVYVGIQAAGSPAPSSDVREYILEVVPTLLASASSLEIVLEGDGISTSLLRTVVRAMVTVGRARLGRQRRSFIHGTVREALERVAPQLGAPVGDVYLELVAQGLAPREVRRSTRAEDHLSG
jgi:hypothetical protein